MVKKIDKAAYAMALLRLGLGYIFLWAFFDKIFGLGFATCKGAAIGCSKAWVNGGSPTKGFLSHATTGPLANTYHQLAGQVWVDWLFMAGLAFVGVGLVLGTWIRAAVVAGIAMMLLMWSALLWPVNSPGVDEHIIYAIALLAIFFVVPVKWSLNRWWSRSVILKYLPFLK